jgi:hypothetical protein
MDLADQLGQVIRRDSVVRDVNGYDLRRLAQDRAVRWDQYLPSELASMYSTAL